MSTRVYLPSTLPDLAEQVAAGVIAATEACYTAPDESEEGEYSALMEAAGASSALVVALGPGRRRRVVVVAEVARVGDPVPLSHVVAVHVDTQDDADPDDDLAWFASQEIPALL